MRICFNPFNKLRIRVSTTSDTLSVRIADEGMVYFMRLTGSHAEDTPLITLVFELFGTLAYQPDNLASFVSNGGVQRLVQTLKFQQDEPELLIKAMQTLRNCYSIQTEQSY